jgi:hypothetical protein
MRTSTRFTLVFLLGLALAPSFTLAQSEQPEKEVKPAQSQISTPQPYLITLAVKESSSGKAVLEKNYSLTVVADDARYNAPVTLRDSDRIPFESRNVLEYHDIGTNIDCNAASRRGEMLIISIRVESNSLAAKPDGVNLPVETKWSTSVVASLLPGKPTVVYSSHDALTGHKVEILATAQQLNNK